MFGSSSASASVGPVPSLAWIGRRCAMRTGAVMMATCGRLREIGLERRRFGYRRLGIMLAREGIMMNYKKLLRLYLEENLRVRRRRGRKRAMGTRAPMMLPQGPNKR